MKVTFNVATCTVVSFSLTGIQSIDNRRVFKTETRNTFSRQFQITGMKMTAVQVRDTAGDNMCLLEMGGKYLPIIRVPGFQQEAELKSMTSWKARADDVLICAYPKSGKTSHRNFVH